MTQDKTAEILERIQNLPEDAEIPEDIINDLDESQIVAIYVEQMIADKGVEATDELRVKLRGELEDRITENLINALPDDVIDELDSAVGQNTADDKMLEDAINASGIDVEAITEQTMTSFRNEYLGEGK